MWMPQCNHLILTASRLTPFSDHLATHLILKSLEIIFVTVKSPPYSASVAASKSTRPLFAWSHSPTIQRGLSTSPGSSTILKQQMGDISACISMSNTLASSIPQRDMALIPAHSVETPTTMLGIAPETDPQGPVHTPHTVEPWHS